MQKAILDWVRGIFDTLKNPRDKLTALAMFLAFAAFMLKGAEMVDKFLEFKYNTQLQAQQKYYDSMLMNQKLHVDSLLLQIQEKQLLLNQALKDNAFDESAQIIRSLGISTNAMRVSLFTVHELLTENKYPEITILIEYTREGVLSIQGDWNKTNMPPSWKQYFLDVIAPALLETKEDGGVVRREWKNDFSYWAMYQYIPDVRKDDRLNGETSSSIMRATNTVGMVTAYVDGGGGEELYFLSVAFEMALPEPRDYGLINNTKNASERIRKSLHNR